MPLSPLSLNHLNLPARDPAVLRSWYIEKLGFEARGRFLWSGASLLVFVDGEPVASETIHFGFRLESIDALRSWVAELRARGVPLGDIAGDESYSQVYVKDPEGNTFELFYEAVPDPRDDRA